MPRDLSWWQGFKIILETKAHFFRLAGLKFIIIFYFIYFWSHWVFGAACRSSLVAVRGGYSSLRCMGFSLRWLLL